MSIIMKTKTSNLILLMGLASVICYLPKNGFTNACTYFCNTVCTCTAGALPYTMGPCVITEMSKGWTCDSSNEPGLEDTPCATNCITYCTRPGGGFELGGLPSREGAA